LKQLSIATKEDFITLNSEKLRAINSIVNKNNRLGKRTTRESIEDELGSVNLDRDMYSAFLEEVKQEMRRVKRVSNPGGTYSYSGKGKKGTGMRDDKWMAWIMVMH